MYVTHLIMPAGGSKKSIERKQAPRTLTGNSNNNGSLTNLLSANTTDYEIKPTPEASEVSSILPGSRAAKADMHAPNPNIKKTSLSAVVPPDYSICNASDATPDSMSLTNTSDLLPGSSSVSTAELFLSTTDVIRACRLVADGVSMTSSSNTESTNELLAAIDRTVNGESTPVKKSHRAPSESETLLHKFGTSFLTFTLPLAFSCSVKSILSRFVLDMKLFYSFPRSHSSCN